MASTGCNDIFGKINRNEIPSDKLYDDDKCFVIRDINPQAPTHLLVIPKKCVESLAKCSDEDTMLLGHLLRVADKVAVKEGLTDGYRTVVNTGKDGGQEVMHLHIHILGKRQMSWPPG